VALPTIPEALVAGAIALVAGDGAPTSLPTRSARVLRLWA